MVVLYSKDGWNYNFVVFFLPVIESKKECSPVASPHTYTELNQTKLTIGSVRTIKCPLEYDLIGSAVQECLHNGEWSGLTPICKRKKYMYII